MEKEEQFPVLELTIEFLIFRFPVAGCISFFLYLPFPFFLFLNIFHIHRNNELLQDREHGQFGNFNYPEIWDIRRVYGNIFLKGRLKTTKDRVHLYFSFADFCLFSVQIRPTIFLNRSTLPRG